MITSFRKINNLNVYINILQQNILKVKLLLCFTTKRAFANTAKAPDFDIYLGHLP